MMAKWQRVRIEIPKEYKPAERKLIANDIINHIIDRSEKGVDKNGKQFKGYTKNYVNSKDFKRAGKKKSPVNLTFTGDMLNSIELISDRAGTLLIGHDKTDKELNGKSEGNRLGTYGNKKPVQKPRDYLGITQTQLDKILAKYPLDDKEERKKNVEEGLAIAEKSKLFLNNVLGEDDGQ
jgi:hypothetical protein